MSTVKRLRPCWGRPNWTRNFPYRGAARLRSACRGAGVLIIGVVCFVVGFVLGGRSSINSTNSEETVRKFLKPAHRIAVASHTQPQHPDVSPVFKSKINGPISYVQVSTQRSGSTWLVRLLNAHPQIYDQGEVFLNPAKHAKLKVGRPKSDRYLDIATTSKMAETPLTVGRLKLILGMAFEAPSAGQATQIKRRLGGTPVEKGKSAPRLIATGFKWMLNQGLESHREHALRYLRENQVRVIVLARRNLLRQCISLFDMQHRQGSPHVIVTRKGTVLNDHRIENRQWDIPKGFFIKCFRKHQRSQRLLRDIAKNVTGSIYIEYESLQKRPAIELNRIQTLLNVPKRTRSMLSGARIKQVHRGPVSDHVKNWPWLKRELLKTEFGKFIEAWEAEPKREHSGK